MCLIWHTVYAIIGAKCYVCTLLPAFKTGFSCVAELGKMMAQSLWLVFLINTPWADFNVDGVVPCKAEEMSELIHQLQIKCWSWLLPRNIPSCVELKVCCMSQYCFRARWSSISEWKQCYPEKIFSLLGMIFQLLFIITVVHLFLHPKIGSCISWYDFKLHVRMGVAVHLHTRQWGLVSF